MGRFLSTNGKIVIALGSGVLIGSGAVLLYKVVFRDLTSEVARLAMRLEFLNSQVKHLKEAVAALTPCATPDLISQQDSSGEDDEFLEALEGFDSDSGSDLHSGQTVGIEDESSFPANGSAVVEESVDLTHIDKLLDGTDEDKIQAYNILQGKINKNVKNASILWRLAKATTHMATIEGARGNTDRRKILSYKAIDIAKTALKLAPNDPGAHKWFAIALGNVNDFETIQVKLENGNTFRDHIMKAIQLNPQDYGSYYLLGRWCYGIYNVTWFERKAASAFFATLPSSSVDEALHNFMKAEELKPGAYKDNLLYIAKCHIEKRNYAESVKWLEKAKSVNIVNQDDKNSQLEIENLLYKYSSYKS